MIHSIRRSFSVFSFACLIFCFSGCPSTPLPVGQRVSLEKLEASKCRLLRARLVKAGATPHALPLVDRVPLPRVGKGEVILSFVKMGNRYLRFMARADGVSTLKALSVERLDSMVMAARDEIEHGPLQGDRAAKRLAALGKELLHGAGQALRGSRRVLMLPDGLLRLVPFHALELDGEVLAMRLIVHRAPCLALAGARSRGSGAALVLPDYGGDPGHLAGAKGEVANLSRQLKGARILRGGEVTADALAGLLASPLEMVHFAGHGLADLTPGAAPELLLNAQGASLTVKRATARPVKVGMVVLAACSAGQAARFRDGKQQVAPVAFTDALLAAGAGSVVASSWRVKDRLSSDTLTRFHRHLAGRGPSDALRKVQLDLRKRLQSPHPRLWGAYAVYGGW